MTQQKYSAEQIESQGIACKFTSQGQEHHGWIMPDGFGVAFLSHAGYTQALFAPASICTDNNEGLRRAREAVANLNYLSYEFGYLITDSNGWDDTHSDDWTKVCYGEDDELDGERVRLALHVRFKPQAAEPTEAYALDLATGNKIGGVAE